MKPKQQRLAFFEYVAKNISIKNSLIENAGLGAFSMINISPNRLISFYMGEKLTAEQFDFTYPRGFGEYVLQIKENIYIDANNIEKSNFTRYINDFRGSLNNNPNVMFTNEGYVKTIRRVNKGEELYIDYGNTYFKNY